MVAIKRLIHVLSVLKKDLVTFYKNIHSTIPLSPLFEEVDTPLLDFYVLPQLNLKTFSRGEETKTQVKSLSGLLKPGSGFRRDIYLSADAGFGKTAFSKYLAVTWCQAHHPVKRYKKYFSEDASKDTIDAMREFEFLFLVLLRDSAQECSVDELILNQIVKKMSPTCDIDSLREILDHERCLVILDGLDEWINPDGKCTIPNRKPREMCVILTTTRPWQLGVLNLSTSQTVKVELVELSPESAQKLKENAISKIKDLGVTEAKELALDLNEIIRKNKLRNLESVPLFLMYLICLWCDNIPIGQSKCELYTSIIELLLSRTIAKYPALQPRFEPSKSDIPQCFCEHGHCKAYCTLLAALGKLAYETLFGEVRENTLVFDSSTAEKHLKQDYLDFSLRSGILTQNRVQEKITKQSSKVSFSHKSVQEYFSALYISCQNESGVEKIVQQNCKSVENIFNMWNVFVFSSGMNAEIMSSVSELLMPVIIEDPRNIKYRTTTVLPGVIQLDKPLQDIQKLYISCMEENEDNNFLQLCLEDFRFDLDQEDLGHLTRLAIQNKNNIKSINIRADVSSSRELIGPRVFTELCNLQKICLEGECKEADMVALLQNRSVKYLTVDSWCSSWSSEMCKAIQYTPLLQAIYIRGVGMCHDDLNELLKYIVSRNTMTEIRLQFLCCTTHKAMCPGFSLDISQHSDLRTLQLYSICLSQLDLNESSLECCHVAPISTPSLEWSWLSKLPAASKLHTLKCWGLKSSGDIETLVQTLPMLVPVKHVELLQINLGGSLLSLSREMVNIEYVELYRVRMSSSSLYGLVNVIEKLPHSVRVDIECCDIEPKTEFADVRKYIHSSESFDVIHDRESRFEFQTIKQ